MPTLRNSIRYRTRKLNKEMEALENEATLVCYEQEGTTEDKEAYIIHLRREAKRMCEVHLASIFRRFARNNTTTEKNALNQFLETTQKTFDKTDREIKKIFLQSSASLSEAAGSNSTIASSETLLKSRINRKRSFLDSGLFCARMAESSIPLKRQEQEKQWAQDELQRLDGFLPRR